MYVQDKELDDVQQVTVNDQKTDVIYIASSYYQDQITIKIFVFDKKILVLSTLVRNLGVIFDNRMTMRDQITALCRTAHFHLRNIGRIRKSITDDACEKLIHAFATTRLDCANANLYDLPDNQLHQVQRMFNIAARILTLTAKSDHITLF